MHPVLLLTLTPSARAWHVSTGYSNSPSGPSMSSQTTTSRMFGHGGATMGGSPMQDSPSYHMMAGCESDGGELFDDLPTWNSG